MLDVSKFHLLEIAAHKTERKFLSAGEHEYAVYLSLSNGSTIKGLGTITNLILWGGIVATAALAIISDHRLITIGVGIIVVLGLLVLAGLLMTKHKKPEDAKPEGDRDDHEPEVYADWSVRAKQRKREGKTMIGGTVPSIPSPISSMVPKIREAFGDFPTFPPDEIAYDDSIAERDLVDDTLVDDTLLGANTERAEGSEVKRGHHRQRIRLSIQRPLCYDSGLRR